MIQCQFENGNKASLRHVVADVIIIKNKQILLVKRAPHLTNGGKYAIIGGFVDRDETIEQAAVREALEETGYAVKIQRLLQVNDSPNRPQEDRQNIAFVYVAEGLEQTGKPDNESTEIGWFDLDKLPPKEQFAFDHHDAILSYLKTATN